MKQQQQRQPRLIGATSLALLVLSYAMALPWLVRGEAVDLVPFLCALVFGCCLIRPVTLSFERASKRAKALAVTLLALLAAAIATAVAGGHAQSWLAHLRTMPRWQANHLFFLCFALLPLSKGIVVAVLNLISLAARGIRGNKP